MSEYFAKLFDFDGHQVLITSDTGSDDDTPQLTIRTHHAGLVLATTISFRADDAGEALRDRAFANADQDFAAGMRSKILDACRLGGEPA